VQNYLIDFEMTNGLILSSHGPELVSFLIGLFFIYLIIKYVDYFVNDWNSIFYAMFIGLVAGIFANFTSYVIYSLYAVIGWAIITIYYIRMEKKFFNHNACILISLYISSGFVAPLIPFVPPLADPFITHWINVVTILALITFIILLPISKLRSLVGLFLSILQIIGLRELTPGRLFGFASGPALATNLLLRVNGISEGFWFGLTAVTAIIGAVSVALIFNNWDMLTKSHQGLIVNDTVKGEVNDSLDNYPDRYFYRNNEDNLLYWEPMFIPKHVRRGNINELTKWCAEDYSRILTEEENLSAWIEKSWSQNEGNQIYVVKCTEYTLPIIGFDSIQYKNHFGTEITSYLEDLIEIYEESYPRAERAVFVTNKPIPNEVREEIIYHEYYLIESID